MEKETEKTTKQSNSLMRMTKAQLVDVILRKDDVERKLRKDVKDLSEENKTMLFTIDEHMLSYNSLKDDYQEICDEYKSDVQELQDKVQQYKTMTIISVVIIIGLILKLIF